MKEYHDLCNHLCVILGESEILLLNKTLDENTIEKIKTIIKHADCMRDILYQIQKTDQKPVSA